MYISQEFTDLILEAEDVKKIKVKHPGILEVEPGKFLVTPAKHFVDVAKRKGHGPVTKALMNLVRWNKGKGGEKGKIAAHAGSIQDFLKKQQGKK